MAEWCLAHPMMTFWLAVLGLLVLDVAIHNVCVVLLRLIGRGKDADHEKEGDGTHE